MIRAGYEKENEKLIEKLNGYLDEELELNVISWLNELIEIVSRGMNDNNNSTCDSYLILPEDHEQFQKLMCRVDTFYTDKYEKIEYISNVVDDYEYSNFDVTEIDAIDFFLEIIREKEKSFNYSNNDKKKIKKLKKQLKDYQDVMAVLFYVLDLKEEYTSRYEIWNNLAGEKDKKLLGGIIDVICGRRKKNFATVMFHFFLGGTFRVSHSLQKLYGNGLPYVKAKMDDLSLELKDKVNALKLKFSLKREIDVLKDKETIKEKKNVLVNKVKDKINLVKANFSLKNKSSIKDRSQNKKSIREKVSDLTSKLNDKLTASGHLADYLTYKNYKLAIEFTNKNAENLSVKDIKKYAHKVKIIDKKYQQILKGRRANEVLDDINNVSATHAHKAVNHTEVLLQYNSDGFLDAQKYLDFIRGTQAISETDKATSEQELNDLYNDNLTFKDCLEIIPENLQKIKKGYRKVVGRMAVLTAGLSIGMVSLATATSFKFSNSNSKENEITIESESSSAITSTEKDETVQETQEPTINITPDETLEESIDTNELQDLKEALLKVQTQINQKNSEKVEDVINIGDFVSIRDDAYIYADVYSLATEENAKTSFYQDQETRVVESIIVKNATDEIVNIHDMAQYENLIANGYEVIGYTVANQYSTDNITIEGRYQADDVLSLTRK